MATDVAMTTTSTNHVRGDYEGEEIASHVRIIFIILGILYIIIGVVGNLFIIVIIFITKTMRNPHYYFIVNLALGDLIITGYVLPHLVISLMSGRYPAVNQDHCIFNGFVIVCAYVSSLLSLMVVSINRYLSVCHSQLFNTIFSNKILSSTLGCCLIWFLAILSPLPCLVGWGRFIFDKKTHYCGYDRTYNFGYTLYLVLFSIGLPVIVVFACNFAIWRFVRQASHRIYAFTNANNDQRKTDDDDTKGRQMNRSGNTLPPPTLNKQELSPAINRNPLSSSANGSQDINGRATVQEDNVRMEGVEKEGVGGHNGGERVTIPCNGTSNLVGMEINEMKGERGSRLRCGTSVDPKGDLPRQDLQRENVDGQGRAPAGGLQAGLVAAGETTSTPQTQATAAAQHAGKEPEKKSNVLVTPDELALIKTVFIIFITFAVFMTPYMLSTLIDTDDSWSATAHITCSFTSFTNSCLNCLLYGFMTPAFKKAFKRLLPCYRCRGGTAHHSGGGGGHGDTASKTFSSGGGGGAALARRRLLVGQGPSTQSTA